MWDDIIRKTIIPTKLKTTCHKTLYICLGIPWQQNLIQKLVFQRWFKNQCSKLRRFSKNRKKHRFRICFFFKHLWRAVVGCPYPLCKDLGFRVASDLRKKKQYQWCSHTKARHQTWPGARNSLALLKSMTSQAREFHAKRLASWKGLQSTVAIHLHSAACQTSLLFEKHLKAASWLLALTTVSVLTSLINIQSFRGTGGSWFFPSKVATCSGLISRWQIRRLCM